MRLPSSRALLFSPSLSHRWRLPRRVRCGGSDKNDDEDDDDDDYGDDAHGGRRRNVYLNCYFSHSTQFNEFVKITFGTLCLLGAPSPSTEYTSSSVEPMDDGDSLSVRRKCKKNIDLRKGLSADMGRLHLNELYSDVEFLVEDRRLPAHRFVLSARSMYFQATLSRATAKGSKACQIRMEVPLDPFKLIIGNTGTLDVAGIMGVLFFVHFFDFPVLEPATAQHLKEKLTMDYVFIVLNVRHTI
ncbi:GL26660 [Drosophila persimilis]|uniref:GL26660 n=1 Tax=Drosophila persimilis TaxID=7234 RepID=B4GT50_DROPE|nr:GL26660 [Drosophila persimilis]